MDGNQIYYLIGGVTGVLGILGIFLKWFDPFVRKSLWKTAREDHQQVHNQIQADFDKGHERFERLTKGLTKVGETTVRTDERTIAIQGQIEGIARQVLEIAKNNGNKPTIRAKEREVKDEE